jgi:hypothetical protein
MPRPTGRHRFANQAATPIRARSGADTRRLVSHSGWMEKVARGRLIIGVPLAGFRCAALTPLRSYTAKRVPWWKQICP